MVARDTSRMPLWLMLVTGFVVGVVAAQAVTVRRYSPSHVVGEVSLAGRGLFFQPHPGRDLVAGAASWAPLHHDVSG